VIIEAAGRFSRRQEKNPSHPALQMEQLQWPHLHVYDDRDTSTSLARLIGDVSMDFRTFDKTRMLTE
jgi:anti-sigma-K factor RskA